MLEEVAKQSGKPMTFIQQNWEPAKKIIKDQYKLEEDSPLFLSLMIGMFKHMVKLSRHPRIEGLTE